MHDHATATLTSYEWEEIGRHNQRGDCWIVIDGIVYDVTPWIDRHPGGDVICTMAGQDVSALFHSSHFKDVGKYLPRYRIGIVAEPKPSLAIASPFLVTLKARVHEYFTSRGIDYRRVHLLRPQVIASALVFAAAWTAVYVFHLYPFAVLMGVISCAMVGGFAHEYCHSTLVREGNRLNWQSMACSVVWAVVCPFMAEKHFQYEHFSHHVHPMNEEYDYEIFALRLVLRLAPEVPYKSLFRYQQYYAPLVYCFYITIQVMVGFTSAFFRPRKLSRDKAFRIHAYLMPLVTIGVHVVIPIALAGPLWWLLSFLAYNAVWQLTTYFVAAVVHMTGREERASGDWAFLVCARSVNVLCSSAFYRWLSGGFNYQIDHHLLPSIARENLPAINPIVRSTCAEFGYPYKEYTSFRDYVRDHYRYLASLGKP
ncbi:MAG TPA: fatty acid desaturase [Thermoanaerobaculia bacterium]|nr:fatty acid desaturase [Thermoanaerobaculia bacterium]